MHNVELAQHQHQPVLHAQQHAHLFAHNLYAKPAFAAQLLKVS